MLRPEQSLCRTLSVVSSLPFRLLIQSAEKSRFTLNLTKTPKSSNSQAKLANISTDEAALDEKIERRKREFEQMQKRYAKLQVRVTGCKMKKNSLFQSFRPAHMDEYEKYEKKLKEVYEVEQSTRTL